MAGTEIQRLHQQAQLLLEELNERNAELTVLKELGPRPPRVIVKAIPKIVLDGSLTTDQERAMRDSVEHVIAGLERQLLRLKTDQVSLNGVRQERDALWMEQAKPFGGHYGQTGVIGAVLTILGYILGRVIKRRAGR